MNTTTRDFAAEYLAARTTVYRAKTVNGSADAISRSARILDAADAAGVRLDALTIDEVARVAANGGAPLRTRPATRRVGTTPTGLPIYG